MINKLLRIHKSEKNLLINILLAFVIKGFSLLVSVFSTPLYINYFNDNVVLGVWYTILSVLSWITIADLGLGNGLRNKLTQALSKNDTNLAKRYISSAYVAISAIIIPITIIGLVVINLLDLNSILKISDDLISSDVLRLAVSILFFGVCINFILKIISNVLYAMQKSSINNLKALITSIVPVIYMLLFKSDNIETNLILLSVVHIVSICAPSLVASLIIYGKPLKDCKPSIKLCDKDAAKDVMGLGLRFFGAQLLFMFLMSTNEVMINIIFLPEYVVEYNIYYRVFTTIGSLFMLALTPLWSKVTQDIANNRFAIVKKTNRMLYLISGAAFVAELAIIPLLQWLLNVWLKEDSITVNYTTAIIFAFFGGAYIFNIALTTVANGIGDLKTQIVFYGIGSILKIPTILLLKNTINHWNTIVLYNAVVLFIFCIFQLFWIEKKINTLSKNN